MSKKLDILSHYIKTSSTIDNSSDYYHVFNADVENYVKMPDGSTLSIDDNVDSNRIYDSLTEGASVENVMRGYRGQLIESTTYTYDANTDNVHMDFVNNERFEESHVDLSLDNLVRTSHKLASSLSDFKNRSDIIDIDKVEKSVQDFANYMNTNFPKTSNNVSRDKMLKDANRLQANIEQPDNSDYEYGRY